MKTLQWRQFQRWMETGGKTGAVLGMVLVLVLAVSLAGLGLLQLSRVNAVEVSRSYNSSRAFWAAEAGLFHAKARLQGDVNYRPYADVFFSAPTDSYVVQVSSPDQVNYMIVSTGTVQGAVRIVKTSLEIVTKAWPDAFDYSLFSGDTMKLAKNTSVTGDGTNGDIFASNGFAGGSKPPATTNSVIYDGTSTNLPSPCQISRF